MYDGMLFEGMLCGEEWPGLDVYSHCVLSKISQLLDQCDKRKQQW